MFVTAQTLVTFPVATSVITTLTQLSDALGLQLGSPTTVSVCLSMLWAGLLYYMDITDPATKGQITRRDYVIKLVIAFFNGALLAAAVLGIGGVLEGDSQPQ